MASLSESLVLLATRIGTECKTLHTEIGTLSNLTTEQKTSLVAALNEIAAKAGNLTTELGTLTATVGQNTSAISTNTGNISTNTGNITALQTAVSELDGELDALKEQVASATNIDDSKVGTTTTYSSSKITSEITAAKQAVKDELLNGAGEAYDTLKELADLITTNASAIEALEAIAAGAVHYDKAQELTDPQKAQARTNIGAGAQADVADLQGRMTAVEAKASANETNLGTLTTNVGNTAVDLVSTFETALAGN